jgi:tetratricopeptide (TPR) repeat protein
LGRRGAAHNRNGSRLGGKVSIWARKAGNKLSDAGDGAGALAAIREAVDLQRRLVQGDGVRFEPDFASSLNNLGIRFSNLGRQEEGLKAWQEAVLVYRRLAKSQPDTFLPNLASCLNSISGDLSILSQHAEALQASEEAVGIYRQLAGARPADFLPHLASNINSLGVRLSNLGQHARAVKVLEEAVAIYRGLTEAEPDAYFADLAASLNNLGIGLSHLRRSEEGQNASGEALAIHQRLLESRGSVSPRRESGTDVFISFTSSDRNWAFWIATELQALGYLPHIHEWEIEGGDDIYNWIEARFDAADHVLCVVSDDYLKVPYSTLERNAALWREASKRPGFFLFVVVKPCKLPTLSERIRRCDLYSIPEEAARIRFRGFMTRRDAPDAGAFPGEVFAVSNIPIRVPEHFMGREDALAAIEAALGRYESRVAITALHGLRGVGKTVLAAAYAERHRGDYRATWLIQAQTEPGMRAELVALGVRLGWIGADEEEEPALRAVLERLRHEGEGILLIFDSATNADSLKPYLRRVGAGPRHLDRAWVARGGHEYRNPALA